MNRLGMWSASAMSLLGAAYTAVVAIALAQTRLVRPIVDPILAWDVFLGISLVCAATVFQGTSLRSAIRICLLVTGSLCFYVRSVQPRDR